jgi:predicted transposase/invertase (TIGR01784 family)
MKRDSLFYRIFQQSPMLLFDLLDVPANGEGYLFDSVEVKQTSFRIDGVFLPPDASGMTYFVEVQFQPDSLLYERMLSEASLYFYRNRDRCVDYRLVVIYPSSGIEQKVLQPHRFLVETGKLIRIYLDQLGDVSQLSVGISLMVLTTLEEDAAKLFAQQIAQRVQGEPDARAIMELLSTILVYKLTNSSREEVDRMFASSLKETRIYRELEQEIILRQMKKLTGSDLSQAVVDRIEALSVEQLDRLAEDLLSFRTVEDMVAWLDGRSS